MNSHLWMLWVWYCTFSFCLDIADTLVVLYLYLVKLLFLLSDVLFFFFVVVLPVMVNKDEYIKSSKFERTQTRRRLLGILQLRAARLGIELCHNETQDITQHKQINTTTERRPHPTKHRTRHDETSRHSVRQLGPSLTSHRTGPHRPARCATTVREPTDTAIASGKCAVPVLGPPDACLSVRRPPSDQRQRRHKM